MQRVYVLEQHVYGQHVLGLLEQNKLIEIIASTDGKKNPERTSTTNYTNKSSYMFLKGSKRNKAAQH